MAVGDLSFAFRPEEGETPETVARRRQIAEAMVARSLGRAPQNVGEGLSAIGQALIARKMMGDVSGAESAGRASAADVMSPLPSLFGGGGDVTAAPTGDYASDRVSQASGMEPYRNAIASIESAGSGDYQAVGPTNPRMGRALGRYQIMESNIGPWSREALGREVTPDEFLANPQIQDAIFDSKFGGYVNQFGPEGAAQAWFAGPGGVGKTGRRDVLGTDVGSYGQRFISALGQPPAVAANEAMATGQPVQVASLDPSAGLDQAMPQDGTHVMPDGSVMADAAMQPSSGTAGAPPPPSAPSLPVPANAAPQPSPALMYPGSLGMDGGAPMPLQGAAQPPAAPQAVSPVQQQVAQALTAEEEIFGRALTPEQQAQAGRFPAAPPPPGSAQPQGRPGVNQIIQALNNPWLSDSQRQVAGALLERELESQDPMRQMQLEKGQIELERLRNPVSDPFTLSPGQVRYDAQGRPIAEGGPKADAPDVKEFFDPETGQPYKAQWNPQTQQWDRIGGTKAGSEGFSVTMPDGTTVQMGGTGAGFKKADQEFAKEYISWVGGGFADQAKQLTQLNEALGILESGEAVTGVRGLIPDVLQPFLNEQGTIAREAVEEVAQRNLREILGPQFTAKEGERLIARAFNPSLPPAENAKRVRRLIKQISDMAASKQAMVDYFQENGTLTGFKGQRPSLSDIDIDYDSEKRDRTDDPLGIR